MALQPGVVFAGYTIERLLGAGRMGAVYLAQHPRLERLVALKVLREAFAAAPDVRAAFEREAALTARLDHPNIVPIYDRGGPDDQALWLSMRYVDGADAASLLESAPDGLDIERTVRLITDAAHALDFAHRHDVLHRDVKPTNLLIEPDSRDGERTLLTDFGIARTLDDTVTMSALAPTFAYTAPERFSGRPADHRADIYSLGCTLFHLLTGQPPFPRESQAAVISAHVADPPPRPADARPGLPAELDVVIATALAKEPADRYPACVDLAVAAARALTTAHTTVVAHAVPAPFLKSSAPTVEPPVATVNPSAAERITRRRLLLGGVVGIPLVGIAGAVGFAALRSMGGGAADSPTDTSRAPATPETTTASSPLTNDAILVYSIAFSPDDSLLATVSSDAVRFWNPRNRQPDGQSLAAGASRWFNSAVFSPDGTLLATFGQPGPVVRLWDVHARQEIGQILLDGMNSNTWTPVLAFSPDGALLATLNGRNEVQFWNVGTRQLDGKSLAAGQEWVNAAAFSPDGTMFATAAKDKIVRLWNMRTRQPDGQPLTGHTAAVRSVAFSPDGTLLATAGDDASARLWDVRTRQPSGQPLLGHTDRLLSVVFSPDGSLLATGSADKTVRLWNATTRQAHGQPLSWYVDENFVFLLAFSPDGTTLATSASGHTVRLWNLAKPK